MYVQYSVMRYKYQVKIYVNLSEVGEQASLPSHLAHYRPIYAPG